MNRLVLALGLCSTLIMGISTPTLAHTPGSIQCWGLNNEGQLNIPTTNPEFVALAAGGIHSLGLRADGSIVAWGNNQWGQCNIPEPNSGFVAIEGGGEFSLGLKADGSVVAWGSNGYNQLDVPEPNAGFTALSTSGSHTLGLKADGSIVSWGRNNQGQCDVPAPNSDFIGVAAGAYHSVGLKSDGSVVTWGSDASLPTPNSGFVALAAGGSHSLGLQANGSIVAWGSNGAGQCDVPAPNSGFVALAGGWMHSQGLKADGSIVAWGNNLYGACNVPEPNTGFVALASGWEHNLGLKADGALSVEPFNHAGALPAGWTIQSNSAALTTPWAPVLENGQDYAVQSSQAAFSTPRVEWLISPIYNLTGYQDIELGFSHAYTHAGSTATVRYSTNGGVAWQNLTTYGSTTTGDIVSNIASWANGQASVRFAFVFTGTFVVGGASWRVDDFFLDGTPTSPTASAPQPIQPPVAWGNLTGSVGCTWQHPLGVSGASLEVRIDANGDGDYMDGGAENWSLMADRPDTTHLAFTTIVTYLQPGTHLCYEFRARSGQGVWGYSGTSHQEGIQDDWYVSIDVDMVPPTFNYPIPVDQPDPLWLPTLQPQVGVTVLDDESGVDASTLAWRIDLNKDGSYNGLGEDWLPLSGYSSAQSIDVLQTASLPADGEYRVEFRAKDLAGCGPAYSMGMLGITDDIVVRVDATPPTESTLFVSGSGFNSVTLMFSPTSEMHFVRYEIRCSPDSVVDDSDLLWTNAQDYALAQIDTYQTTVMGLAPGTAWYFRLWGVDLAGNHSPASNRVRKVTEGSQVSPVADLHAELQGTDIVLTWTAPTTDINGQSPVAIEAYQVHASIAATFTPSSSTLIGTTGGTSYLVANPGGDIRSFFKVVVVGAGPVQPNPEPMNFTGVVPVDFFRAGVVSLTDWLGDVCVMPFAPPGTVSGWDLVGAHFNLDYNTVQLHVGLDFYGIAGDADGDGIDGFTSPWLAMLGGVDAPMLDGSESILAAFDFNQDGAFDLIAGMGYDDGVYRVCQYNGPTSQPYRRFGAPLPIHQGPYFYTPVALSPDFELTINAMDLVEDLHAPVICMNVLIFAGSLDDDGICEDNMLAEICFTPDGNVEAHPLPAIQRRDDSQRAGQPLHR